jgi:magnesium transporter
MSPVSVSVTLFNGTTAATHDGLDGVPRRIGRSSLLWLDVPREEQALRQAAERLGLEDGTVQRALESEGGKPTIDDREQYTHLNMRVPAREVEGDLEVIDCIVGERWVVTVHDRPVALLDDFRERASGSGATGRLDGPGFLATLLEWVLGEYSAAFEEVESKLEETDVRALEGRLGDPDTEMRRLVGLRRHIGSLQQALTSHREAILSLTHPELDALASEESARRFRALVDRFDVTLDTARDARTSVVASFDVLMARTEHRTNEILKVLTLASVVFLPGSLIAAVLGMNFQVALFEHPDVFWVVVGGVLAFIAVTVLAARRHRWI